MNIVEWAEKTHRNPERISDVEWEVVEIVYCSHPAIPDVGGKDVIANLWKVGKLGIIREMLPVARECMELEEKIQRCNVEIDNLRTSLKEISEKYKK